MKCPICDSDAVRTEGHMLACGNCKYEWFPARHERSIAAVAQLERMGYVWHNHEWLPNFAVTSHIGDFIKVVENPALPPGTAYMTDGTPENTVVVTGLDMGAGDDTTVISDVVCRGCWQFGNNCKRCRRCLPWKSTTTARRYRNLAAAADDHTLTAEWDSPDPLPWGYQRVMTWAEESWTGLNRG